MALAVTVLGVLVAAASLVVRFRHARGTERQQLRWVASRRPWCRGGGAGPGRHGDRNPSPVRLGGSGLWATMLPLAIGAAILRYRLYDLDRIISRTLTYGLLTVLLGSGYAGIVLGWASSSGESQAWSSPGDPDRGRGVPAGPPRHPGGSTSASTDASPARPGPSRPTAFDCATSSTWTPSRPNC